MVTRHLPYRPTKAPDYEFGGQEFESPGTSDNAAGPEIQSGSDMGPPAAPVEGSDDVDGNTYRVAVASPSLPELIAKPRGNT